MDDSTVMSFSSLSDDLSQGSWSPFFLDDVNSQIGGLDDDEQRRPRMALPDDKVEPMSLSVVVVTDDDKKRNKQRVKRWATPCGSTSTLPTPDDVIMGRGGRSKHHGNIVYRKHAETLHRRYQGAKKRKDKKKISLELVDWVKSRRGRFLAAIQYSSGAGNNLALYWYEVHDDEALKKTSQTLREYAKLNRH